MDITTVLLAVTVVGFIAIALSVAARRRSAGRVSARPVTLVVTRFTAIAYAALTLVITGISVVSTLVAETVDVRIPVAEFWPQPYPGITIVQGPTASVTSGGFTFADVAAEGLGLDARLLLAGGHAILGLTFVAIATVVALLCHWMLAERPFRPALSRSINLAAVAIAAGGILWQICFGIGGSIASNQLLAITSWRSDTADAIAVEPPTSVFDPYLTGMPEPTVAFGIDFWPLLLGLALAAIAAAFRYGERMQRDTDGLV